MKPLKLSVFLLAVILVALGAACSRGTEAPAAEETPAPETPAVTTETVTIAITGLHCADCDAAVETAVQGIVGVASVDSDFTKGQAVVVFDPAVTNAQAIIDLINQTKNAHDELLKAALAEPAPPAPAPETAPPAE